MCCPRQLATRTFTIDNGKLDETASEVTGTASISMFAGEERWPRFHRPRSPDASVPLLVS